MPLGQRGISRILFGISLAGWVINEVGRRNSRAEQRPAPFATKFHQSVSECPGNISQLPTKIVGYQASKELELMVIPGGVQRGTSWEVARLELSQEWPP